MTIRQVRKEFLQDFAAREAHRRIYHVVERYRLRLAVRLLHYGFSVSEYEEEKAKIFEMIDEKQREEEKKYFEDV